MPNSSPIAGYPYPSLADAPNAQTFGANLTSALDLTTIPHFATFSLLTTTVSSPAIGQAAWVTEYSCVVMWSGSRWIALGPALIAETSLSVNTASVTFSSIPQHFRHLRIVVRGWINSSSTTSFGSAYYQAFRAIFNGDTASNYNEGLYIIESNPANTAGAQSVAQNQYWPASSLPGGGAAGCCAGYLPGSVNSASSGQCSSEISGYTVAAQKTVSARFSTFNGNNHGTFGWTQGGWNNASAITQIQLLPTLNGIQFGSGSIFSLYGEG